MGGVMSVDRLTLNLELNLDNFVLAIDTDVELDGVTAIFGPSGSGKSSLLRAIAGFERPSTGTIRCGNHLWFDASTGHDVAAHRRSVGYMFQDARLFSHLDVAGNLQFALKRCRREGSLEYDHVLDALDLRQLLPRSVAALSGGERQRVALGRTLLTAPRLLLLDEPLTALDQARKEDILPYLERLPRDFGIPTLYVSHDIDEVAHLADRILVLADGRLRATGPTVEILERFDLAPFTGRFEAGVLLEGEVSGHDERLRLTAIDLHGATLTVPIALDNPVGNHVRLRVRARDVAIATQAPVGLSIRNVLPGTIARIELDPDSGSAETLIDVGGPRIRARLTMAAVEDLSLTEGMAVFALIKSVGLEGDLG
jgi:molybdate transport system ATP-binding protein